MANISSSGGSSLKKSPDSQYMKYIVVVVRVVPDTDLAGYSANNFAFEVCIICSTVFPAGYRISGRIPDIKNAGLSGTTLVVVRPLPGDREVQYPDSSGPDSTRCRSTH